MLFRHAKALGHLRLLAEARSFFKKDSGQAGMAVKELHSEDGPINITKRAGTAERSRTLP